MSNIDKLLDRLVEVEQEILKLKAEKKLKEAFLTDGVVAAVTVDEVAEVLPS